MKGPLPLTIFSSTITVYSSNSMNCPFQWQCSLPLWQSVPVTVWIVLFHWQCSSPLQQSVPVTVWIIPSTNMFSSTICVDSSTNSINDALPLTVFSSTVQVRPCMSPRPRRPTLPWRTLAPTARAGQSWPTSRTSTLGTRKCVQPGTRSRCPCLCASLTACRCGKGRTAACRPSSLPPWPSASWDTRSSCQTWSAGMPSPLLEAPFPTKSCLSVGCKPTLCSLRCSFQSHRGCTTRRSSRSHRSTSNCMNSTPPPSSHWPTKLWPRAGPSSARCGGWRQRMRWHLPSARSFCWGTTCWWLRCWSEGPAGVTFTFPTETGKICCEVRLSRGPHGWGSTRFSCMSCLCLREVARAPGRVGRSQQLCTLQLRDSGRSFRKLPEIFC